MFRKKKAPTPAPKKESKPEVVRRGFFSTDPVPTGATMMDISRRTQAALAATFQKTIENARPVNETGQTVTLPAHAMDSAQDVSQAKLINTTGGLMPVAQLEWYAQQGFIGWQTCAMLYQNWLIAKACDMPAKDAIRHGWDVNLDLDADVDPKLLKAIKKADKRLKLKPNALQYLSMGRCFGVRHCMFIVEGVDYSVPFNPESVKPGSYKGMTQIDPYWIAPILDYQAAANPAAQGFYTPTWWQVNGKRVHHSHMAVMINGGDLPDILKPTYMYGGVPTPQKIYERIYAAEKTANEAPQLAMSKRLTVLKMNITTALANTKTFLAKMAEWLGYQNNFGIKVIDKESEEISQFDTSLQGLDETVMTQYQLVAAAADVPATKLMGTSPKGFGASGEYEETSYHETVESMQEHDLLPLLDGHYLRLMLSEIMPKFPGVDSNVEVAFKPVNSMTAEQQATVNKTKAETDAILANAGAIDGLDIRSRIVDDPDSGYTGIETIVPEGPGDRDHEHEMKELAMNPPTDDPAQKKTEAMDDHWITVKPNGDENKSKAVLLSEGGEVKGGMGGKFNGKNIKDLKGKESGSSGGEGKPDEGGKGGESKAETTTKSSAPESNPAIENAKNLSEQANALTASAKTADDHNQARYAHLNAAFAARRIGDEQANQRHNEAMLKHRDEAESLLKKEKKEASAAKRAQTKQTKKEWSGKDFSSHAPDDIATEFKKDLGISFVNGTSAEAEAKELWKDYAATRSEAALEKYRQKKQELYTHPGARVRGHTSIDIQSGKSSAKAIREVTSQVHDALEQLKKSGFDLHEATKDANVSFIAGSTGKANGHAWQHDGKGYFAISPSKRGLGSDAEQQKMADARAAAGQPRWSISTTPGVDAKEAARSTIVHEFAHALGMQAHIQSPQKLAGIFKEMFGDDRAKLHSWLKENVSEYATSNIKEADAELAALVTAPHYKPGTLPEAIEKHVHNLFKKKGA